MTRPRLGPSFPFRCDRCDFEAEGGNLDMHPCPLCAFSKRWWQRRGRLRRISWDDSQLHQRVNRELRLVGTCCFPRPPGLETHEQRLEAAKALRAKEGRA